MGKGVVSDEEDEMIHGEDEDRSLVDDVAVDDSDGGGDGDDVEDEEEEGEGLDEYEKDDFLVDDVEDEEEEEEGRADSDEEERQKKKKKKKREEYVLDDDDYDLLEDNNVYAFRRKSQGKFKRLKKAQRNSEGVSDGKTIEQSLFDGEEGYPLEDIAEEEEPEAEADGDVGEDDMADFIVDDEEFDVTGSPVRQGKVKRRKSTKAPEVPSSSLQEAHDIFGDPQQLIELRKQGLDSGEWRNMRIKDQFEPSVLSEKYMTDKDEQIQALDIPERIQIYETCTVSPPLNAKRIDDESTWIYDQLTSGIIPFYGMTDLGKSISRDDIRNFLELHHVQMFDIPFIAMYRKEECLSLLKDPKHLELEDENQDKNKNKPELKWHRLLWTIQDLDRKWLLLQKRKSALKSYYKKRFEVESQCISEETRLTLNQQLFESVMKSLEAAKSEREVDDADAKFNLHFPPGEGGVDAGQYKRPKRKSLYSICIKAGLWHAARKFGYSSEQFGLQLSLENMRMDELEDAKETPEEMASTFTCAMFDTPQAVLKGARHMAAVEISWEPCVRKYVRSNYLDITEISTNPTLEGNVAIDASHQFAGVKWLKRKPLNRFEGAQWLLIQKAEEEKLLQVTIQLPEDRLNKLISDFNEYYLSDGVSKSAQLWNEQRKLILQDALFNFLLPSIEKEARSLLTSRAKHWLRVEYGNALWNQVSVGPYQRKENDGSSNNEAAPKVMACFWGPGNPATTFVMLDSSGEVLDVLYAGALSLRFLNANDEKRKKDEQERILKFMIDHQPHVVVLGGVNLSCTRLKDDIYEIIYKMVEEHPRDVGADMDGLSIVHGDESLARLYENSRISSDQLPMQLQSGIVKKAVALGRYLQNPLAMVATLCGPGREILSWKICALEHFLTPDEKYEVVEQVMVDVTNQVGIDLNLAISHEWLFAPLQFISGLGPRKAASLQKMLVGFGEAVYTRKDMSKDTSNPPTLKDKLKRKYGLDNRVFINACGFLRVRLSGSAGSSYTDIDLLDDTRINPESYQLAEQLAKDVYDVEGRNDDDDVVGFVREHPKYLKNIDVEEYAKSKRCEKKIITLYDIRRELIQGFQDWRKKYEEPTQDEEFYMITGETEDTLAEGKIVQVTVRRVQADRAQLALECGLTGILMKEDYHPDDWRGISDLSDRLNEGDILTCKIKSIQKKSYRVFLAYRESEIRNDRSHIQNLDTYYQEDWKSLQSEQEKAQKSMQLEKKNFNPRMIVHPRFQNISADESMRLLSDKDPGESIFRPSSRGPSHLSLTLKIYDGVYAHKDIVEGGKEKKDITSILRIGKTLTIGEDTFEDLDEVVDRYVDPLVAQLKAMLNYRKFRRGTKAEVDALLKIEKLENPARIVYSFGVSHEYPGTIILTYIRSSNPHHELVGMYPKGFKFRKRMFKKIDQLVEYFQRHVNDPPQELGPPIRSVAAIVPMRSPATRGSSGASVGSGWGGSTNDGGRRSQTSGRDRSSTSSSRTGRNDMGNFPGAKVQNSPGREAFPGGWGAGGSGSGSGWGGKSNDGWGQGSGGAYGDVVDPRASGWDSDPKRRRFR
ncbi:hypothetical protein ACFX13_004034 [Malus domestica]|uniref:Transcription elongation factor spt6 n=1 Tax=Malus domestica TaxID=3750 RepID=A0A498J0Z1_MALDO|nr:hypothetical protein DVH24_028691 [Malus domestica]